MSIKDTAKSLLKKGIATGDDELIIMANELLESLVDSKIAPDRSLEDLEKVEDTRPEPDSFISPIIKADNANHQRVAKTQKIDVDGDRENKFVDDLSEHTLVTTPDKPLTARHRRPFKKVEAVCKKCNKIVETHPAHKREWFVCDGCIKG
jgi:formamidopyrimidine-DNA glycosylase